MVDSYPVLTVAPAWDLKDEQMGSKDKFWYTDDDGRYWLFKIPRPETGEHWAEKIAAEIAAALHVTHARVELAQFDGQRGSAAESFAGGDLGNLYHGNQLLAGVFSDYDPDKVFKNSSHTLENIWLALDEFFGEMSNRQKETVAEYIVLDALIGNTDRHHQNWALLRRRVGNEWGWSVAPSYDHASSLGRELSDQKRDLRLADEAIGDYSEGKRVRGGIYWSETERRAPSPLELARRAHKQYPTLFAPALKKLERLGDDIMREIVNRIPDDWMTSSSRAFALASMRHNMTKLRELGP